MKNNIEMDGIVALGVTISGDFIKVCNHFGANIKCMKDLRRYAWHHNPSQKAGLEAMALKCCGIRVIKTLNAQTVIFLSMSTQ